MPVYNQPKSLIELSENQMVCELEKTCYELDNFKDILSKAQLFSFTKNQFRKYWCNIASHIRRAIFKKCMENLHKQFPERYLTCTTQSYTLACMLIIMLDIDIRELSIQMCCYDECHKKDTIFNLLASGNAIGLNSLEFIGMSMTKLNLLMFRVIVSPMDCLTILKLRNIACDDILKIIGEACHHLEILDISQTNISDRGIKNLLQLQTNDIDQSKMKLTTMTPWGHAKNVFSNVMYMKITEEQKIFMNLAKLIKYCQNKTKLCYTLRELNISDTNVTDFGILRVYLNVLNLETLGDYCKLGQSIEILDKCTIISPKLQLTMINLYRTSTERMQITCNICTKLKKIVISDPLHNPFALSILPNTITKIHLNHIPVNRNWLIALYTCLPARLQELSLKFQNSSSTFILDLGNLLFPLVSLRILKINGINTTMKLNPLNISLKNLEKISITQIDNPKTLQRLLKCTPGLEILHIFNCNDLYNSNVINVLRTQNNLHLKCFYVNYLPDKYTNTITHLITLYPELVNMGNVDNWGISQQNLSALKMNNHKCNLKLEFQGSSHWYQSECF